MNLVEVPISTDIEKTPEASGDSMVKNVWESRSKTASPEADSRIENPATSPRKFLSKVISQDNEVYELIIQSLNVSRP